jgi:hypothetical protein
MSHIEGETRGKGGRKPRNVEYTKTEDGHYIGHIIHGDRFCIELKTEGITWKTTSSKKVPIEEKLEQAKKKLEEFYEQFPYLKQE